MDHAKFQSIVARAVAEESQERAQNSDLDRPPFHAAVKNRLLYDLYQRLDKVEADVAALQKLAGVKYQEKGETCPECGEDYSLQLEGGVSIGCQPGFCGIKNGRRAPKPKPTAESKRKEARA